MRITARWQAWMGAVAALPLLTAVEASAQIKAQAPPAAKPAWSKGIQPIGQESYWNAVECGKQGGTNPPCVFYDANLCKNEEFALSLYTPYKFVAYTVWQAVQQKKEPPSPSYAQAQRTPVVFGIKALRGSQNPLTALNVKRGGRAVKPVSQVLDGSGGTFTYDFATFAPTAGLTIELVGRAKTVTCLVDTTALARFR